MNYMEYIYSQNFEIVHDLLKSSNFCFVFCLVVSYISFMTDICVNLVLSFFLYSFFGLSLLFSTDICFVSFFCSSLNKYISIVFFHSLILGLLPSSSRCFLVMLCDDILTYICCRIAGTMQIFQYETTFINVIRTIYTKSTKRKMPLCNFCK